MIRAFLISILLCLTKVCQAQDFAPSRSVEEMDDGVIVTYTFKGGMHRQDCLYPEAKSWTIPGFGQNMKAGEPSVPVRWDTFSVPSDRVASIELMDCAYTDTAFVLAPSYPPLLMSDTIGYTRDVVLPIQPYQGLFPNSVIQQSRYQSYRGNRMVKVGIYPIQYDAVNQRVRQYSMIQYKLNFTEIPQSELRKSSSKKNTARISASDYFLKNVSLNTPQITSSSQSVLKLSEPQPSYQSIEDTRTFLIITTPSIASGVEDFKDWKQTMGMNVITKYRNSWTTASVKDTIQYYYNNYDNLYYLLIIGDIEQVPSHQYIYEDTVFISDAYYSYMEYEGDDTSDFLYGRIPVKTANEAHDVLAKIIQYEKNPPCDEDFYNNATICSSFLSRYSGISREETKATEYSEQIRSYLMDGISPSKVVKRIYNTNYYQIPFLEIDNIQPTSWHNFCEIPIELQKPNFQWNGNTDSIVDAINSNTFLVTGIMHGDKNGWKRPNFYVSDTIYLQNNKNTPIIFSMACKTGKFDESNDCFAEALLKKKNGGAIALLAATAESINIYTETQLKGYINSIWPNPGINEFIMNSTPNNSQNPVYEIGEIMQQGYVWMGAEHFNANSLIMDDYDAYRFQGETFHCFGDPSMQIYTQMPLSFNNPEVYYSDGSIIVQTYESDVRISFYDYDDWVSESYKGNFATYEPWLDQLVYVCLTKPNYKPYIVQCMNNSVIQNETISKEKHYAAETMKIGTNVVDYIEHGNVLIDGGKVSIRSKTVEILPNTTIINSEFKVIPTN